MGLQYDDDITLARQLERFVQVDDNTRRSWLDDSQFNNVPEMCIEILLELAAAQRVSLPADVWDAVHEISEVAASDGDYQKQVGPRIRVRLKRVQRQTG